MAAESWLGRHVMRQPTILVVKKMEKLQKQPVRWRSQPRYAA